MSKYTDKFLAMMRRLEVKHRRDVDEYEADGFDVLASAARDEVADWRAMREAWEAMENVCELVSYGVYSEPDNCLAEAKAALAKARVE